MKSLPSFSYEAELWKKGHTVIGIDEVGRGAFAGPVGVGGVIFESDLTSSKKEKLLELGINDSKKLTAKKREYLSKKIKEMAKAWHVSFVDVTVINEIGIGKAVYLGMREVYGHLKSAAHNPHLIIDAFTIPGLKIPQTGIIKGDCLSISIASASIIAKVERDALMENMAKKYPVYGFERHKGYGTSYHRSAITANGLSNIHREAFCVNYLSAVK